VDDTLSDIELCAGGSWHGQSTAMAIRNADKARKSVLKFDVMLVFIVFFFSGQRKSENTSAWPLGRRSLGE
jgi:hypothetical protein